MRLRNLLLSGLATLALGTALARSWCARPLVVHEWGVEVFDAKGNRELPDLPPFLHTPAALPKGPVTRFSPPVREMPADSGERDKPILYFYLGEREEEAPVALSLCFAYGVPSAWYPQADQVCAGFREAPDDSTLGKWIADLGSSDFKTREEASRKLVECGPALHLALESALAKAGDPEIKARLKTCLEGFAKPQLTWDHLKLSKAPPAGIPLPGKELRADHWVRQARQVDAAYVTNGVEAERYVFYEGRTKEKSSVSCKGNFLTNHGTHPVHDLYVVCKGSVLYVERLEPSTSVKARPLEGDASRHLLERLQAGRPSPKEEDGMGKGVMMRKPCEAQGPTTESWLFPKEAEALLAIWEKDFFQGEGARLIYREDVSALDEAMPLAIYTDMFHFIKLNRAGLVLVKGVSP